MNRRTIASLAVALLAFAPVAACSDDTEDDARSTIENARDDVEENTEGIREEAAEKVDEGAAMAAAQELRTRIKANDTANEEGARSMAAIEESVEDLVGDPTVSGHEDGDGDGLDDDGKVQLQVDESYACVTLPAEGEDTTVEGGEC